MPKKIQDKIVKFHAHLIRTLHSFRKSSVSIPFEEYLVAAYDDLTPRWRHYHDPIEVSRWYYENGFSSPVLSHWDNPYGFGLVAEKIEQEATPGIHYGNAPKNPGFI